MGTARLSMRSLERWHRAAALWAAAVYALYYFDVAQSALIRKALGRLWGGG